jgi:DNA-binding beta-propeller fold protein YncE
MNNLTAAGLCLIVAGAVVAGCSGGGGGSDATELRLSEPGAVAVGSDGALYVADTGNCTVWKIDGENAEAIVGTGACAAQAEGSAEFVREIGGVAVAPDGAVYVSDTPNCLIRRWRDGTLSTFAGTGVCGYGGDGGDAGAAQLDSPAGLAVDAAGTLYVADAANCRVRQIAGGIISTLAGNGSCGFAGDGGPPGAAQLDDPAGVAVDALGRIYIAEAGNCRVRLISDSVASTFAGDGECGFGEPIADPLSAGLGFPRAVATGGTSLYVADTHGCRIIEVSAQTIAIVAGDGSCGVGGDGGPATSARLDLPGGVAVAPNGDLFIADTQNCSVRRVRDGPITTVVGRGSC